MYISTNWFAVDSSVKRLNENLIKLPLFDMAFGRKNNVNFKIYTFKLMKTIIVLKVVFNISNKSI